MRLNEIFDTDLGISPEDWNQQGRFLLTRFKINGQGYIIQLERKPIEGIKNATEVSFFRSDINDSDAAFSTTNQQMSPATVYGIVANAVLPVADKFDAILVNAERRHSSSDKEYQAKLRIYNSLVQGLGRRAGFRNYTIPEQYQQNRQHTSWLISKVPPEQNSPFKDEQKMALECVLRTGKIFVAEEILKQ